MAEPRFGSDARPLHVVRSPLARRMSLRIDTKGQVRLSLPTRAPLAPALAWAETKRGWIETQLARRPEGEPIRSGMTIVVAGVPLVMDWAEQHPRGPRISGDRLTIGGPLALMPARLMRWLKAEARRVLTEETTEFAHKAGVSIASVGIGDPASRWGSCASTGAIRYSWRLILAPDFVRRATVAHEVAHRVHMDHSPRFYALLGDLLGTDPKPARHWLRLHGAALHSFGGTAASGSNSVG
jgi:predicted metal-dependent hydrolase